MSRASLTYGDRISSVARRRGSETAIVSVRADGTDQRLSWRDLDARSRRAAGALMSLGAAPGATVAVELPNGLEHYVACIASWKAGACVFPLDPKLPSDLREAMLELARPVVVIGAGEGQATSLEELERSRAAPPRYGIVAAPGKAIASGASTGTPKLIVDPRPWSFVPGAAAGELGSMLGMRSAQVQLVAGPLCHNTAFTWSHLGLADEHCLIVMERFDAAEAWRLIESCGVQFAGLVPTMMKRMLDVEDLAVDLSRVEAVFHAGGPCAHAVKMRWIELLGSTRLYEAYGATESIGATIIRGDEWLSHPGSVGRPIGCELEVRREDGTQTDVGEVGEVFMRPAAAVSGVDTFRYLGADTATVSVDGFRSVGDLGCVDAGGYLYLSDRRTDLIVSGGVNVYPAEVEGALLEHPAVSDVAVIGLPDDEWGSRVHAVIQPHLGSAPSDKELRTFLRDRLHGYKVPKSFEHVESLPRTDAGKLNRSALRESRMAPAQMDQR